MYRKTYGKKGKRNGCIHHVELFIYSVQVPAAARKGIDLYGKIRQEAMGRLYALIGHHADSTRNIVRQPPVSGFSGTGVFYLDDLNSHRS